MKPIKLLDLHTAYQRSKDVIHQRMERVLEQGMFIMGPEVLELERELARLAGVKHAVTCSSGTDALLMPLMAKEVKPGDAVFTTPFTFVATAEVITRLGATPVFVDIDPQTRNMDPVKLEEKIQETRSRNRLNPRGIISVDLFGLPADYDAINRIASQNGLFVIEDAAQSFGAAYKGRKAGGLCEIGATSFFPAKPLGCFGDGGAIFINDDDLAERLKSIRNHGQGENKYDNIRLGINGRLDTIQAAVLLARLEVFEDEIEARRKIAALYGKALRNVVDLPFVPESYECAWAQYSIQSPFRDAIIKAFQKADIPYALYYPKPLHLQTVFNSLGYREGDFPVAESVAKDILSLPMHPYLEPNQIQYIAEVLIGAADKWKSRC